MAISKIILSLNFETEKVTSKISYPADFSQAVVLISADIDDLEVEKSIPEPGIIEFKNDNVFVADGIIVFALIKAAPNWSSFLTRIMETDISTKGGQVQCQIEFPAI